MNPRFIVWIFWPVKFLLKEIIADTLNLIRKTHCISYGREVTRTFAVFVTVMVFGFAIQSLVSEEWVPRIFLLSLVIGLPFCANKMWWSWWCSFNRIQTWKSVILAAIVGLNVGLAVHAYWIH